MPRTLIIGGTLFIGRALVERLLERGDDVVIMHRGTGTPFGDRVSELHADRTDVAALARAVRGERFDYVFDNVYDWQRGTSGEQVRDAAVALADGLRRYVFTSSVAVFPAGGPYDEDALLRASNDANVYGAQKADSERALLALQRERGIPVNLVRPAFIYGPHNPFDREAFFWDRILADKPIIVPDDGARTMQWVHVGDVARAAIAAATNDSGIGRAYNLANPPVTQTEFVRLLGAAAGREPEIVFVPRDQIQRAGGQFAGGPLYFGDYLDMPPITVRSDRVREELGVELRPLAEGLRETFEWYRTQRRPTPDTSFEERLLAVAR